MNKELRDHLLKSEEIIFKHNEGVNKDFTLNRVSEGTLLTVANLKKNNINSVHNVKHSYEQIVRKFIKVNNFKNGIIIVSKNGITMKIEV